uniref:PH_15 domain-containing protein n=1 Tax=Angiostrongylus cantonensis TaxID=6313 RepID=A0A0K0D7J8_ANGCA
MECLYRFHFLPEQLCSEPGSMCGYVEKALSMSKWERRLAVITKDGKLTIYKYYLLDMSARTILINPLKTLTKVLLVKNSLKNRVVVAHEIREIVNVKLVRIYCVTMTVSSSVTVFKSLKDLVV